MTSSKQSLSMSHFQAVLTDLGGSAELGAIVGTTGVGPAHCRRVLNRLIERGRVTVTEGVNSEVYALATESPEQAAEALMTHASEYKPRGSPLWYSGPYRADLPMEVVVMMFEDKYERTPDHAHHSGGGWLVGPLTDAEVSFAKEALT